MEDLLMVKKLKLFFTSLLVLPLLFVNIFAIIPPEVINLAKKLNINPEELHLLLKSEDDTKELLPMDTQHKEFYLNLYTDQSNAEHMKYYGHGKILTKEKATEIFNRRLTRMWNQKMPGSLAFVILNEGKLAGFIGVGPIDSQTHSPEIGRVIEKNYAGKGLGTFSAKTVAIVLQYLKNLGKYNYTRLISTSKPENEASRKSVMRAGFITDDKIVKTTYGPEKVYIYEFK